MNVIFIFLGLNLFVDMKTTEEPSTPEVPNGCPSGPDNIKPALSHRISRTIKRRCRTVRKCLKQNSKYLLYLGCVWFGCVALWQMMYGGIGPGKWILMVVSAACKKVPGSKIYFSCEDLPCLNV